MINRIELILKEEELFCNFFFFIVKRYSKFLPISIYELMETIVEKNIIEPLQTVISIRVTRFRTIIHRMCIESSMLKF